jgi:hypothetical protein
MTLHLDQVMTMKYKNTIKSLTITIYIHVYISYRKELKNLLKSTFNVFNDLRDDMK